MSRVANGETISRAEYAAAATKSRKNLVEYFLNISYPALGNSDTSIADDMFLSADLRHNFRTNDHAGT